MKYVMVKVIGENKSRIAKVHFEEFPDSIEGLAAYDTDNDRYFIGINRNITRNKQIEALGHEVSHIEHGDLLSERDLSDIEWEALKRKNRKVELLNI
jgi:hypothetical protein